MINTHVPTIGFTRSNDALDNSALADIGDAVTVDGLYSELAFVVTNEDAAIDLASFALLIQPLPGADWFTLLSGSAWQTLVSNLFIYKSADIDTLDHDSSALIRILLGPCYAIKFQAQGASGAITIGIKGMLRG